MPNGNSESSVLSVLKNNQARGWLFHEEVFWARRGAERLELRIFDAEEGEENGSKRMQVSVASAHRKAMIRSIKVCRMVILRVPCYPC